MAMGQSTSLYLNYRNRGVAPSHIELHFKVGISGRLRLVG